MCICERWKVVKNDYKVQLDSEAFSRKDNSNSVFNMLNLRCLSDIQEKITE